MAHCGVQNVWVLNLNNLYIVFHTLIENLTGKILINLHFIHFVFFIQLIKNFYLELRKQHQTQDSTPITTRQLESLIRLTEARARLELREEATKEDAEDIVEIMKYRSVLCEVLKIWLNKGGRSWTYIRNPEVQVKYCIKGKFRPLCPLTWGGI